MSETKAEAAAQPQHSEAVAATKRGYWRRCWRPVAAIALAVVLCGIIALRFMDSQASRWAYVFQAYIHPRWRDGRIPWPAHYTGTWRTWRLNGQLRSEHDVEDGEVVRVVTTWEGSENKELEYRLKNGKAHGTQRAWEIDGDLVLEVSMRYGIPHGQHREFAPDGTVSLEKWFIMGRLVDEHAFQEWIAREQLRQSNAPTPPVDNDPASDAPAPSTGD